MTASNNDFEVSLGFTVNTSILVANAIANSLTYNANSITITANTANLNVNNYNLNSSIINLSYTALTLQATGTNTFITSNTANLNLTSTFLNANSTIFKFGTVTVAANGFVGINATSGPISVIVGANDGIIVPVGNSSERPSTTATQPPIIRYTTDTSIAVAPGTLECVIGANTWWSMFFHNISSGRLVITSANSTGYSNTLAFIPFNGDRCIVNSYIYQIPSAGVSANIHSCIYNGTANTNLANGFYYVFLQSVSNTLSLYFSNTQLHAALSTTGVEVSLSNAGRTLVGEIYVLLNSLIDNPTYVTIASWYNRRLRVAGYSGLNTETNATTPTAISTITPGIMTWSTHAATDDDVGAWASGTIVNQLENQYSIGQLSIAGALTAGTGPYNLSNSLNQAFSQFSVGCWSAGNNSPSPTLVDSFNLIDLFGSSSSASSNGSFDVWELSTLAII